MELVKLLSLIVCSAALLFLVLPAIVVFFIFRARDLHKSARWAKAGVIVFIILAVLLLGVIVLDAVDLFVDRAPAALPTEPLQTIEASEPPTLPPETTEATEDPSISWATITTEQLDGQWIAISEPEIPEDENYTYITNGGYYLFSLDGSFTFTQIKLAKAGTWQALPGDLTYTGTYILEGDLLTLHYTNCTERTIEEGSDDILVCETILDETETISMQINQSCTQMCVMTPEHPKLGMLFIFQKGHCDDPVEALRIALNAAY